MSEISDLIRNTLCDKVYEKELRIKCLNHVPRGLRNLGESPARIKHEYPIKNGLSIKDLMLENIQKSNKLYAYIMERSSCR